TKTFKKFAIEICTLRFIPTIEKKYNLNNGYFSHIFIDEAGQSPEMDCWLPLHRLTNQNTRLILSGNPKNTCPMTEVAFLEQYGYKKSLIARLCDHPHFVHG